MPGRETGFQGSSRIDCSDSIMWRHDDSKDMSRRGAGYERVAVAGEGVSCYSGLAITAGIWKGRWNLAVRQTERAMSLKTISKCL